MQTLTNSFSGAGTWEINIPGKYFALIACNNACNIRFYKGGKKLDLGEINGILSGLECTMGDIADPSPAFDRVQVEATGADTVTIGIGNGQARYNRGGQSNVTVLNVNGPFAQAAATVTNASAQLIAASATRRYALIQNKDVTGNIWVNLAGAAATTANGIKIGPGGSLEIPSFAPTGAIFAIGDIASNANIVTVTG
mgnify:CR=1 FL=1